MDHAWDRVEEALRACGLASGRPITATDRLMEDLGLDSLALARIVVTLEDRLGAELPAERLHELRGGTVGSLAALVRAAGPAP